MEARLVDCGLRDLLLYLLQAALPYGLQVHTDDFLGRHLEFLQGFAGLSDVLRDTNLRGKIILIDKKQLEPLERAGDSLRTVSPNNSVVRVSVTKVDGRGDLWVVRVAIIEIHEDADLVEALGPSVGHTRETITNISSLVMCGFLFLPFLSFEVDMRRHG